jgi:signal transduction histidine kinase
MSILARLVALVLLALVPAIAAHAINAFMLLRDREQEIRDVVFANAQVRNAQIDGIIGGVQHLLGAVVRLPAVASLDRAHCNEQLAVVTSEFPLDVVLAVADLNGTVLCSSLPRPSGAVVADRAIFQEVIETRQFGVGEYVVSPVTGVKTLSFGHPIPGNDDNPIGVVIAYLDLDWLVADLQRAPFLPGRSLTLADRRGIVLAQAPGGDLGVGRKLPSLLLAMIDAAAPGVARMTDATGRPVLYGYTPITVPPPNIYVLFGIDEEVALAPMHRAAWRGAALSLLSVLAALAIAWMIGVSSIRRPVRRLLDAAASWRRGDYSARANLRGRSSEIVDLGRAFDGMAEKLQLRDKQLAAADRIKDIILAAAGHDLRQPLQVITMAIAALSRRPLDARERQHVERADKAVDRLVDALDALIDASRAQYGMAQPERQSFALDRLLQDMAGQWSFKAAEKGLRFRVRPCPAVIECDPRMLATLLRNLVGNAVKYTDRGGILVGCRRRGAEMWIEIFDTGIGIPEDKLAVIFDDFRQLDPQREGLGLGLWIAHSTAAALGYGLSVRSIVGRGSRFRIVMPLATAGAVDSTPHAPARVSPGAPRSASPPPAGASH